jgi:hypothetical protein
MTHGDKAKAKAAKSSKASVKEAGTQGGDNGKSKTVSQAGKGSKAGEAGAKGESSSKTGSEKAAASPKDSGKGKGSAASAKGSTARNSPAAESGGFNNPVIGAAFKQALKKYPNALRKLTD